MLRLLDDITAQFRHQPVEQAAPQIVTHIRLFWAPRMRSDLTSLVQSPTGDELIDAVVAQLRSLDRASRVAPPGPSRPARFVDRMVHRVQDAPEASTTAWLS